MAVFLSTSTKLDRREDALSRGTAVDLHAMIAARQRALAPDIKINIRRRLAPRTSRGNIEACSAYWSTNASADSGVDIQGVYRVYTHPCQKNTRYFRHSVTSNTEEIPFDIAEQFFLAQDAPKAFVAGLRPDPLVELTALPQTP